MCNEMALTCHRTNLDTGGLLPPALYVSSYLSLLDFPGARLVHSEQLKAPGPSLESLNLTLTPIQR